MANTISNTDDVIDSRDVIARIEELTAERDDLRDALDNAADDDASKNAAEELAEWDLSDDGVELNTLLALAEQGENCTDWNHGAQLIRDSYFEDHIRELIADCYEMPKEFNSGEWPWRHMTIDYAAAAKEAQSDYTDIEFDGVTYWVH